MNLILSRHGNTFAPGSPVVWAGASNDLPLVESGVLQAQKLAQALTLQNVRLSAVYCSALKRTHDYAKTVIGKMSPSLAPATIPIIDSRLHEIDYGLWTGLTNDQVASRFGEKAVKNWEERSEWPDSSTGSGWRSTEAQVIQEVKTFYNDIQKHSGNVLVITSNGRLRYFLTLVDGEWERRLSEQSFKVKTGNVCGIDSRVKYWNQDPTSAQLL